VTLLLGVQGPDQMHIAIDGRVDEHTLETVRDLILKFADSARAAQYDKTIAFWLAGLAGKQIQATFKSTAVDQGTNAVADIVTARIEELQRREAPYEDADADVPLPSETITASKNHEVDLAYAGIVLLAVLAWLVYFAGPHVMAKVSPTHQFTFNDYWSIVPSVAVALTGYLVTHPPKRK
jgi:hypothetical protein